MSKLSTKSARPGTAHSVIDMVSEERRWHSSLGASLQQALQYYDIPDDLDADSLAPSKENSGYSSRNLMDCQAELRYSTPQGPATPPGYYGGNNEEEEEEEDEEANQVGMYRTRLNVQRSVRSASQSTLMMTGDEAVEAMTREARLATAAKIEALNASEEAKNKKEWEAMWQSHSGTWMSPNFLDCLGDSLAPSSDSRLQPKPVLGPPPLGRRRASSRRDSVCSFACDGKCDGRCDGKCDGDSLLTSNASDLPVSTRCLGRKSVHDLDGPHSQELVLHSNMQALADAQAQANLPRQHTHRQPVSRDSMYSYCCHSSHSQDFSYGQTQALSLDYANKPGELSKSMDMSKILDLPKLGLDTSVPMSPFSQPAGAAQRGPRQPQSTGVLIPDTMRGEKLGRRRSVTFGGEDSGSTLETGPSSSSMLSAFNRDPGDLSSTRFESQHTLLSSTPESPSFDEVASIQDEVIIARMYDLDIVGSVVIFQETEPMPVSPFVTGGGSVGVDRDSASPVVLLDYSRKSTLAGRFAGKLSSDSPAADDVDADSASRTPTLASRFAGKLRLLTGSMTNDRSCSVAPEPKSTHCISSPGTKAEQLRGYTSFTNGISPMARRRFKTLTQT
eukprot:gene29116-32332_t